MAKTFVDRGAVLNGINQAVRESRIPYTLARKIENFSMPDSRARRRTGYTELNSQRVLSQSVTKVTGSTIEPRFEPAANSRQSTYKTPMSYGLVREISALKPSTISDWSMELRATLGDLEDLVVEPFERRAKKSAPSYAYDIALRTPGVYLLDWTIMSNQHEFDSTGTIAAPGTIIDIQENQDRTDQDFSYDVFPLTTLAISFTKTHIQVEMGMVATATHANPGRYWPREINLSYAFPGGTYTPGDNYHIALTYDWDDVSTGVLRLYIDGTEEDTYTVANTADYDFIGGNDKLNNIVYASGIQRDIVLLNECSVRGSYASSCRIQNHMHGSQTFFHDYSNDPTDPSMPWCCSPPRGTKMRDLRFWSDLRSQTEVNDNKAASFDAATAQAEAGLIANWPMSDGVSLLLDNTTNAYEMTLHHTYSPYVTSSDLLHNLGVHFADGQYLILRCKDNDEFFIKDIASQIKATFGHDPYTTTGTNTVHRKIQDRHNFTGQIQITTPSKFQEELNEVLTGAPYNMETLTAAPTATESRSSMAGSGASVANEEMDFCALRTGEQTGQAGTQVAGWDGNNEGEFEFNRAYDQTLFSIEGSTELAVSNNHGDFIKQVLGRASLTPDGKVAFECYLSDVDTDTGTTPAAIAKDRVIRIVSSTTLSASTTYVITVVKRSTYVAGTRHPTGLTMEIWIGVGATAPTALDVSHSRSIVIDQAASGYAPGNPTRVNMAQNHPSYISAGEDFQVLMKNVAGTGAAIVNGFHTATWVDANSFDIPVDTTALTVIVSATFDDVDYEPTLRSSCARHGENHDIIIGCSEVDSGWDRSITSPGENVFAANNGNHGPYYIPKQYNSPYQQQPGFFTLGYFRLWKQALSKGEIQNTHAVSIATKDYTPSLLINLEVEDITGNGIPNKSRYPITMDMGYISWGVPQSWEDEQYQSNVGLRAQQREAAVTGAHSMEDCLGFTGLIEPYTILEGGLPSCLAPFRTTVTNAYGLLFGWREHISLDTNLDGSFQDLFIQAHGILNDFAKSSIWQGVSVGDRTILTSDGGIPKTYNGKNMVPAGFKRYSGGRPIVATEVNTNAALEDGFYGVAIVYRSEEYNLQQYSATAVVEITSGPKAIEVYDINPHPDPRVTSIIVHRTRKQSTFDLARVAALFPISDIIFPNAHIPLAVIEDADDFLLPLPLDLRQDPVPVCRYGTLANGRLYLTGDSLIPDAVYYSDVNNPEKFDILNQRVLLRDTGADRIQGIVTLFGSIFVFKANSIWRIDELNGGVHQRTKVADVGATSENSIQIITIPDTGRTVIFYWSEQGPYLFDGSANKYIGYQLELFDPPVTAPEGLQVVAEGTVVVMHDLENREVICSYLSTGGTSRKYAVAYNYRFNVWSTYYGLNCDLALSDAFSGKSISDAASSTPQVGTTDLTHQFLTFMAGPSGRVYRWGDAGLDGLPAADTDGNPYTVNAFAVDGGLPLWHITLNESVLGDYTGLYLAVVDASDGDAVYMGSRIVSNTTGANSIITVVALNQSGRVFIPVSGDKVYLCLPAGFIEFPWDTLDAEFVEKQIDELISWHDGEFKYQVWKDWDLATRVAAGSMPTGDKSRKETYIGKSVESFKLEITTYEDDSAFDAFAYKVEFNEDGITS